MPVRRESEVLCIRLLFLPRYNLNIKKLTLSFYQFHLEEIQFNRCWPAENGNHHFDFFPFHIYFADRAGEVHKRTVVYFYRITRLERARREGVSMNRLVKSLLASAVGLDKPPETDHREDFLDLFGTWSEEEAARFHERIKDLERIEPGDWES